MQVQRTDEQQERDNHEYALEMAHRQISMSQAKEIYKRHQDYAKRASNLSSLKSNALVPAMQFEKLLLEQRLIEINEYLDGS